MNKQNKTKKKEERQKKKKKILTVLSAVECLEIQINSKYSSLLMVEKNLKCALCSKPSIKCTIRLESEVVSTQRLGEKKKSVIS